MRKDEWRKFEWKFAMFWIAYSISTAVGLVAGEAYMAKHRLVTCRVVCEMPKGEKR